MPVPRTTKDGFAEIYRSVLPAAYVAPLDEQDDGAGMDLPYAFATMAELADCASNKGTQAYFRRPHSDQTDEPAAAPTKALGAFVVSRVGYSEGSIVIPAGTLIEAYRIDSYGDEEVVGRYLTIASVTVAEGTGETESLAVEAEYPGYFGNLLSESVLLRFVEQGTLAVPCVVLPNLRLQRSVTPVEDATTDRWSQAELGRYVVLEGTSLATTNLLAPRRITIVTSNAVSVSPTMVSADIGASVLARVVELSSLGLVLSQPTAISGGKGGMLDAAAADDGVFRLAGEPNASLLSRLESLSDNVSPPAIARAVDRVLGPLGIAWRLMETGDPKGLGGRVWDLHPWDFGDLGPVVSSAAVYDVQGAVWLSTSQTRRFFVVAVSTAILTEPSAAMRVWNDVQAARGGGVGFRLVIDSTL
jgi:hypothetical protein